jgi:hypothetical protein
MLALTDITMRQLPDRLQVPVELPDITGETDTEWEGELAIMDLWGSLPDSVAVIVHDSSGGIKLDNLASLELSDSSGDIEIDQVAGPVLIPRDSSGDIDMRGVGAVTIQVDSSGEIFIDGADSVTIANDTSGDITLRRVSGNVLIGKASSSRTTPPAASAIARSPAASACPRTDRGPEVLGRSTVNPYSPVLESAHGRSCPCAVTP